MIREIFEMLREYVRSELHKIRSLDKGARGGYVFDYHKGKLIAAAAVILCAAGVIAGAATHRDTVFNLAIVNQKADLNADAETDRALLEYFGANPDRARVNVDSSYQIVWGADAPDNADYTDYEKFFLNLAHGEIDCAVVPEGFFDYCLSMGAEVSEFDGAASIGVDGTEYASAERAYEDMGGYVAFFPKNGKNIEYSKKFAERISAMTGGEKVASQTIRN